MDEYRKDTIFEAFFNVIVTVQGLILLVQGTIFAWLMGSREKVSETLDFHRNAPQKVNDKIAGLIFGSTFYEWSVFGLLSLFELFFVPLDVISLPDLILYNLSLILSGILLHSSAVNLSLLSSGKRKWSSPIVILFFLWFVAPPLMYASSEVSPFFGHLFGLTGFKYVFPENYKNITGFFFTLDLPLIMLEIIVQVPVLLLMIKGLNRIFTMPNSPAWSKPDVIRWGGFVMFMVAGFSIAEYVHFGDYLLSSEGMKYSRWVYYHDPLKEFYQGQIWMFVIVYFFMGVLASVFMVPTYFKTAKYAVLEGRGLIKKERYLDDGASSLLPISIFVGISLFFYLFYLLGMQGPYWIGLLGFILISSYVFGYAGLLELFRIGKYRNNKIILFTVIMLAWVFIPWVSSIIFGFNNSEDAIFISSISPFTGIGHAVSALFKEHPFNPASFIMPWTYAFILWIIALRERGIVENARRMQIKKQ
jgi:hypothetical protein